jgi:hypothetical protein
MRKLANPLYRLTAPASTKHQLLHALQQASGRSRRWRYQAIRRYLTRFRPLTPGEGTVQRIRAAVNELNSLLEPFRRTRLKGHEPLRELLFDTQTQPVLVAQVA